ncbi:hypothetical protein [Stenomitos frigidus]|nr:hypothetical protein [Stenomitos frigidus]
MRTFLLQTEINLLNPIPLMVEALPFSLFLQTIAPHLPLLPLPCPLKGH